VSADDYGHRQSAASRVSARLPAASALAETAPLVAVLAAAGVLFHRGLALPPSFDEGVYVAQTDALLHGQRLGTDVFAAQPPGFHWLLLLGARLGGATVHTLRLEFLAFALLGLVAAYLAGRALAGPWAGVAAAAVLAVAPPYPTYAVQVSADLPGTTLALLALACLLTARGRRRAYAAGGLLLAAAEWVKLDAFLVVLPALAYVPLRRLGLAVVAALAASVVGLAVVAGSLPDVWHGAVSYHLAARGTDDLSDNVAALRSFFHPHQPFTWLVVAALVATVARRTAPRPALWGGALLCALFLLWHHPLHDNHLVLLSVALAVPVGAALATARPVVPVAVVVTLAIAAGYVQETHRLERNAAPVPAELRWAATVVDAHSTPADVVVSDEPLVGPLAHRRLVGSLIDTAVLRFDSGYLTDREVLAEVDRARPPVVVAGRAFLARPALLRGLAERYPRRVERNGVRVYLRPAA
jgi:4-amino-4-deoxy-L-arabinose transferase-like glycosyltransferase